MEPLDALFAPLCCCYALSRQIQIMDFGNNCLASLPDALIQESYFPSVRECILQGNSLAVRAEPLRFPRASPPRRLSRRCCLRVLFAVVACEHWQHEQPAAPPVQEQPPRAPAPRAGPPHHPHPSRHLLQQARQPAATPRRHPPPAPPVRGRAVHAHSVTARAAWLHAPPSRHASPPSCTIPQPPIRP